VDLICYSCVFIKYWAGLHLNEEQGVLGSGAEILQRNALDDAAAVPFLGTRLLGDALQGDVGDENKD
jgi:hypothetical protein